MSDISRKRKNSILLLCAIIIISFLIYGFNQAFGEKGEMVVISVDGKDIESFPLSEDRKVRIEGYNGGYNDVVIKDGKAFVESADCPDCLCIEQGMIDSAGESVICLPHRVIIIILGKSNKGIDLISK
ncbi:NusG domain II-containing protein [Butyrivibrio sp. NC2002]|uniref:NusG domain II-containing protein n=1 Tax=Butyrivibrio sp. NC2002 TaxID=1410610 RepID=UPI00056CA4AD|nr:NusG domain II-containing protein [Butyrivibrio sp. NC2002]